MSQSRFNAIDTIQNRPVDLIGSYDSPETKISDYFGVNVFNDEAMQHYLPEEAYLNVKAAIQSGANLSRDVADVVAGAMKRWAMERGATHYAHWFQPWTGKTAEKHDSFFTLDSTGRAIEEFGGKELAQQEPDGSSFPGGGLRSTFEARGYTAWDPSSPAFLFEVGDGKTLCIPTILVTYSGEAMDFKLPLLKSLAYLEDQALPVAKWFDDQVSRVTVTLGWEQEYFLVDEALYNARPDLVITGRTLIGKLATKGQELEDHYFGSIPERVFAFMRDLEQECHRLGIPVRTRHNEVGPGQYELAPMFEEANVAVDHNQLLMDLMDRIARRHHMRVLLHEKPFTGVNGSGKHNNWSMGTNTGKNLLSPGEQPGRNLRFLTFFVNTIMAVREHADLLRASVASASNDHRLGANEAPPAIVSIFIGSALNAVLKQIEKGHAKVDDVKAVLNLLSKIPDLEKDNTDRNRTSPFAFTGNKFEVRMVGSHQNCAAPMTVLNTIVGDQLRKFRFEVDQHVESGSDRDTAILTVLKSYVKKGKSILFEGDNYSQEWENEAAQRGLGNFKTTPEALEAYVTKKSIKLFEETGVFSNKEVHAFYEVQLHKYSTTIEIESTTLEELCLNYVMPGAIDYQTRLAQNMVQMKEAGFDNKDLAFAKDTIKRIAKNINSMHGLVEMLDEARRKAHQQGNSKKAALVYCHEVKELMTQIRSHADDLELIVDDREWGLVKYRELMYIR
ncbi:MAG: glutamine synthetase III [Saprospiraceae bacterium]|jgi:glutamine synthetase|nr:glutamine synthetase III [Saprospiraceae bacterium]